MKFYLYGILYRHGCSFNLPFFEAHTFYLQVGYLGMMTARIFGIEVQIGLSN